MSSNCQSRLCLPYRKQIFSSQFSTELEQKAAYGPKALGEFISFVRFAFKVRSLFGPEDEHLMVAWTSVAGDETTDITSSKFDKRFCQYHLVQFSPQWSIEIENFAFSNINTEKRVE